MNKSISYQKQICKLISSYAKNNNITIQKVPYNNLKANAAIVKNLDRKFLFVRDDLPTNIFPIIFFHEYYHLKFNKIGKNFENNKKIYIETCANIYAILKLKRWLYIHQLFYYIFVAIISEKLFFNIIWNKNIFKKSQS